MSSIEDQIKEAELRKLRAEEAKINSEKAKIDSERDELDKPFHKKLRFIQVVIAGIVGGIAILGVFKTIIEPTFKKDIIKKEAEIAERELDIANQKRIVFALNDSNETAKSDIRNLEKQNQSILDSIELVKKENLFHLNRIDKLRDEEEKLRGGIGKLEIESQERLDRQINYNEMRFIPVESISECTIDCKTIGVDSSYYLVPKVWVEEKDDFNKKFLDISLSLSTNLPSHINFLGSDKNSIVERASVSIYIFPFQINSLKELDNSSETTDFVEIPITSVNKPGIDWRKGEAKIYWKDLELHIARAYKVNKQVSIVLKMDFQMRYNRVPGTPLCDDQECAFYLLNVEKITSN